MTVSPSLPRRRLGSSGIEVSISGLGGNVFGPPRLDLAQTRSVIAAVLELGVNFVDTANVYGQGQSESFLGEALGPRRDQMVIATKFNLRKLGDEPVARHVRRQAEDSLRKLRTDYIDLYQLHFPSDAVTAQDLLEVLTDLVSEGKVRAIGACNFSAWRLADAAHVSASQGWPAFATAQNYYHLLARHTEAEVIPYARRADIGLLPYHPLAGGFLTGKYQQGQPRPEGTRGAAGSGIINTMDTPDNHHIVQRLNKVAGRFQRTVGDLALAWLAAQPAVTSVIAGVSNIDQLRRNIAACQWVLDQQTLDEIDEITAPGGVPAPEVMPYRTPRDGRQQAG